MLKAFKILSLLFLMIMNSCSNKNEDECSNIACVNIPDSIYFELKSENDQHLLNIETLNIINQKDQSNIDFEIVNFDGQSIIIPSFEITQGTHNYSFILNNQIISKIKTIINTSTGCCSNMYYESITIEEADYEYNDEKDIYVITVISTI